ncbi:ATP-binding protein [Bifidobacterium stellenboschense]|uniref:AAA ATPase domain protein n=1 Tax=Bifidobacterium stellenboschense TaxID=762211 RepID=A0A087DNA1_9BIFI|nr:ATP-binding protein [Bifidobacterium stellenboschense]KFI97001.1 AAA ATPase domain protein [Bifidobacterium stellenboschense]
MSNPFKPTAGMTPPVLVGRKEDLEDFSYALDDGVGAPGRLMYVTGARGVGKTVMLNALGDIARKQGWLVIDETAESGFLNRLIGALQDDGKPRVGAITMPSGSLTIPGTPVDASLNLGSIQFSPSERALDFRRVMSQRLDRLEKHHLGILITLDEVQASSIKEIRALATAVQHLIREQRNIAFVFAGLPSMVEDVINDNVLTFLRRAERRHLGDVALDDVRQAFATTIALNGKHASENVLDRLAQATNGYPLMIQLVGYWTWRASEAGPQADDNDITITAAERGIAQAKIKLGDMVHGPAVDKLSAMSRDYLLAMAQDDGPSSTSVIAKRLERGLIYANVYRTQLIKEDIIYQSSYGYVDFKLPYLRDYLREHGAYHQMRRTIAGLR